MKISQLTFLISTLLIVTTGALFAQLPPATVASGVVHGVVTDDSSGHPVGRAFLAFYSVSHPLSSAFTLSDTVGFYSIRLDTGSYLLVALAFHYYPEWYDRVSTRDSASILTVGIHDTIDVDFGLRKIPPPVFVGVQGTATDSVSGLPLRGALVVYYRPFHWPPLMTAGAAETGSVPDMTMSDPGFGFFNGNLWFGLTDSLGRYTAHVPAGVTLIAGSFKFGYIPEFYDDKHSPFEANKLAFLHDSTGIDFDLVPVSAATNSISGKVVDSAGSGVPSHLVLVEQSLTISPHRVFYGTTDSAGQYTFEHLPASDYVIEAFPFTRYMPAWYDADSCGVADWHRADPIHASGSVTGIDICVKLLPPPGIGSISGTVIGAPQPGVPAGGAGLGGVVVYAASSSSGQILGFDVTDIDGSFSIANLAAGSYTIVAEKEGFSASSTPEYTLSAQNTFQVNQTSVILEPESPLGVRGGEGVIPHEFRLEQNYPNPFNPGTRITYRIANASFVTLKVYDVLGREVAAIVNEVKGPGMYQAEWDASGFPSGVYEYRLAAGSYLGVKKMILLK
jgi:hypothetical protein